MRKVKPVDKIDTNNWNETVLNTVDVIVDTATKKIVKPAHRVAKYLVYVSVAFVLLIIIAFAFSISFFKILNLVMPVWVIYMALGAVLMLIGSVFWAKK